MLDVHLTICWTVKKNERQQERRWEFVCVCMGVVIGFSVRYSADSPNTIKETNRKKWVTKMPRINMFFMCNATTIHQDIIHKIMRLFLWNIHSHSFVRFDHLVGLINGSRCKLFLIDGNVHRFIVFMCFLFIFGFFLRFFLTKSSS